MEYVGAASGAALGLIAANVPGMVYGAKLGYNWGKKRKSVEEIAGKKRKNLPDFSQMRTPSKKRRLSIATPSTRRSGIVYRSSMNRTSRVNKARKAMKRYVKSKPRKNNKKKKYTRKVRKAKDPFLTSRQLGMEVKIETYGRIKDDHCVYIKHSTQYVGAMAKAIMGALIRKVYSKTGYDTPNFDTVLSSIGVVGNNASDWRLILSVQDIQGGQVTQRVYDVATTDSVDSITNNLSLIHI